MESASKVVLMGPATHTPWPLSCGPRSWHLIMCHPGVSHQLKPHSILPKKLASIMRGLVALRSLSLSMREV